MEVESDSDFVKSVGELLRNGQTSEVLKVFNDNELIVKSSSWDLIPLVSEYLTTQCENTKPEVFNCSEKLMNIIAEFSNPEEALLQLIEEIEECKDSSKFIALLLPIKKILFRIPEKRLISFAWGFNAIQSFLNKCKIPECNNLLGKEKLLLDNEENTSKITFLCEQVVTFYDTFEVPLNEGASDKICVLRKFLVRLLGEPLLYVDMEIFDGIKSRGTSTLWSICRLKSTDSSDDKLASENYEDDIKNKILAASLKFVPEVGWSKEALSKGAEDLGYPGISHGMFSRGGADLVHYFQTSSNLQLVQILKKYQEESKENPLPPGDFAEKAIQARLQMTVPYINKWPQAIAIMSLPPNVPNALAALLTMVDDICYYAGDRSVDFNWYLRRIGIAGVYKATELYMIQDNSQEYKNTWAFLKRRLEEAVQVHDILCKSEVPTQVAKDTVQSVFVTARNILGLNWNR
ncbi:unnamed protein product [Phaedon cochleariae]|uniref:Ubiquinone biosynthesis protein n=1 Tax=Phaedon cochleariae TaxID=80249 RepID=A0A9N9X1E1_PHACE|nr:unnamed protein product [Phaedon cochleariae]